MLVPRPTLRITFRDKEGRGREIHHPAWLGLPKRKVLVCNAPADLGGKSPFHTFYQKGMGSVTRNKHPDAEACCAGAFNNANLCPKSNPWFKLYSLAPIATLTTTWTRNGWKGATYRISGRYLNRPTKGWFSHNLTWIHQSASMEGTHVIPDKKKPFLVLLQEIKPFLFSFCLSVHIHSTYQYYTLFQIHSQPRARYIHKSINHLQAAMARFTVGPWEQLLLPL
jgi:hypothetical protein